MSLTRRTKWTLRLMVAIAALALLYFTRRTQVLVITNDSPALALSATVTLGNEVRELDALPPGAVGYVWANAPERESAFKINARWSDGSARRLEACYANRLPQLYSIHPTSAVEQLRCRPVPAPFGIGIPYAAIRSLVSRF